MKKLKTFFYSLKRSVSDPSYYREIIKTKFDFSLKYLFFLVFIITTAHLVSFAFKYPSLRHSFKEYLPTIINNIKNVYPKDLEITIKDGRLSTNRDKPFIIKSGEKTPRNLLVLDPKANTGEYPSYDTYILVTEDAYVYPSRFSNSTVTQSNISYFKDFKKDFKFNRQDYDKIIREVNPFTKKLLFAIDVFVYSSLIILFIFAPIFVTLFKMIELAVLSFLVWIINLIFKKKLQYGDIYRIGMHAVTVPILYNELIKFFHLPLRAFSTPIFLIWMTIIIFYKKAKV
ncbi:DUF1189 family protein [Patescibacteria group bacterium]|nr:DUF1189 family protein [Patescibacteria group bacterium]